jgi:hypothetical protein
MSLPGASVESAQRDDDRIVGHIRVLSELEGEASHHVKRLPGKDREVNAEADAAARRITAIDGTG